MTPNEAKAALSGVSIAEHVDALSSGHVRIETAFRYPDGTSIEVFVAPENLLHRRLTDLGQTTAWLLNLRVKPWLSAKRRQQMEDALRTYGATQEGGELIVDAEKTEPLVKGVIRLSQACLRVADLSFTRRTSLQTEFAEDVEEFLGDSDLPYQANIEVPGRYGKLVRVDFAVEGKKSKSLVLALASQNISAAHTASTEVFRKWYDLSVLDRPEQKVTIFDDRSNAYREEDLKRIKDLSDLIPFSDRGTVKELLAA